MTDIANDRTASLGAWSLLASPALVATAAATAVDWVCLDAQHGEHDDASVRQVCATLSDRRVPIYVRVRANDPALIGRALDSGADGVVVPLVENSAEAAAAAAACNYPPLGRRSWGPLGSAYGREVPSATVAHVRCSVMVETARALELIDEIASTADVDEIFVGPFDLALSLGVDVDDLVDDCEENSPLRRIVAACHRHGKTAAAFGATPQRTRKLLELGFTSVAVATDTAALNAGFAAARNEVSAS